MRDLPERLQELASAYAQLASPPAPGELRRHQRRRRVTAVAWLTLAAVLVVGAVVAGGWVGAVDRPAPGPAAAPPSTKAGTKATTPPSTSRPPTLTGTITRLQEGYRLDLPAGWYAVEMSDPKQLALGYGKPGKSAVEVFVRTALTLDPRLTSAADRKAAVLASSAGGPETETYANRPATRGTRPDGRRFLTIDVDFVQGIPDQLHQIAWPYHCAPGSACPATTRLRALEFVVVSSKDHGCQRPTDRQCPRRQRLQPSALRPRPQRGRQQPPPGGEGHQRRWRAAAGRCGLEGRPALPLPRGADPPAGGPAARIPDDPRAAATPAPGAQQRERRCPGGGSS